MASTLSNPDKSALDPFTRLDALIPILSDLYTAIKARHSGSEEMMEKIIAVIRRITDANPDAALAAIHLSKQTSPLKQPIYCAVFAHLFGRQQQLSAEKQTILMQAVLSCNITFYEFQVLLNSMDGRLTAAQRAKLEKHPLQSALLMEAAGFSDPALIKAIRQHHERPDGSGYPNHLTSVDISDVALMVSMCEVYSARIDNRAYRKPVLAREALAHFNNDQDSRLKGLLLNFAKSVGIYPPGTWVKIANGETAIVTHRQKDSPIPIVRALFDASDQPYMGSVPRDCKQPEYKVISATAPPDRPLVDLAVLFMGS